MAVEEGKEVANWEEKLGALAKNEAAHARPATSNITFRAGIMAYNGDPVPNSEMECIVISVADERTYYTGAFDSDNPSNPACFAIVPQGDDIIPHENVTEPQHPTCTGCPMDAWGSRGDGRRGKACQQRKRLLLIPASVGDREEILQAEVATAKLPVTSVRNWDTYVTAIANMRSRPTFAVKTLMKCAPHQSKQLEVTFKHVDDVDLTLLDAIVEKQEMSHGILFKPYDLSQPGEEEPAKEAKGSKHKA